MSSSLLHPALSDCRRIFLQGFDVAANIGIHEFEKQGTQRIVIDVDLYVPLDATTPSHDKIGEVFDYDLIHAAVRERIARGHINLQETLCDDIARTLMDHPAVRAVRVSTAKPDVYPDCDAVGVEVFLFKGQDHDGR